LRESRHPVIERMMAREAFIPNDARFTEAERVALVTGPNMAGKSTILRQIGLCVVLAQMGAFVPAAEASVGVVDRLFTRVGASDKVVFLHRLEPGGTDRSYGIHVAQLAGLPDGVVRRAREILGTLEGEHRMVPGAPPEALRDPGQLALFTEPPAPDPMVEELRL